LRFAIAELRIGNWKSEIEEGDMDKEDLKRRTKQFALRVIRLVESLPRGQTAAVMGRQLLRSGTSVGANYRAACRAKSTADFISKMGTVEEEADESLYWMELLVEAGIVKSEKLDALMKEADELVAITVASINTAKRRSK
jgi:four helix bundle protein